MHELLTWIATHIGTALAILFTLNIIMVAFVILLENRAPERSQGWLLVLFTFPVIGFILYIFFGHNWHRKTAKDHLIVHHEMNDWKRRAKAYLTQTQYDTSALESKARYLATSMTGYEPTGGNSVRILTDAIVKYPHLLSAIRQAKKSVDLEYYIFRHDETGKQFIELLKQKAKEGVRVRFLVDGYGSFGLGKKAFGAMREAGIHAHYFAPLITPLYFFKVNYRDHRKIVVIDDDIAFIGGINIGNEYLGKSPRGPWRDTAVELRGPCVRHIATIFEESWRRTTPKNHAEHVESEQPHSGTETVNIIPSGPDAPWFAIHRVYLDMINRAERSLIVETPYFIPDQNIHEALINAALRGVDLRIVLPRYPDAKIYRWVAMTYVGDLLRAGARIYEYPVGFLHQKVMIADGNIASLGTCNIDIRSFRMDFEINALVSSPETIRHLMEDAERDMSICSELRYEEHIRRPMLVRIRESLARLIAPLL